MANRKITELNALTGANATDTDVFAIVDVSADETKKMTLGELKEAFDTGSGFVRITGDTMTGDLGLSGADVTFGDNDKAIFGAGSDLQIYHDGAQSYVLDNGTGNLNLRGTSLRLSDASGTHYLVANSGAEVSLTHSGAIKLATTATGVDITGTLTSDGLTVSDGTETTSIPATADRVAFTGASFNYIQSAGALFLQPAGDLVFNGTGAEIMRLRSGRVGIGTSLPDKDLTVSGEVKITGSLPRLFFDNTSDGIGEVEVIGLTTTDLRFGYAQDNIVFRSNSAERMRIDSSGNVGIGTSSPSDKLHVQSSSDTKLKVETTGTTAASGHSGLSLNTGNGGYLLQNLTTSDSTHGVLRIYDTANSAERMRIDSSGNVGIGVTDPSTWSLGKALHIGTKENNLWGEGDYAFHMNQNAYYNGGWKYSHTDEATQYLQADGQHIWSYAGSGSANAALSWSEAMRIDSSGNVGIGTSSPTKRLHVIGDEIRFSTDTNISYYGYIQHDATTTGANIYDSVDTGGHIFKNSGTERMRIDSSGNVGIGKVPDTWSSAYKAIQLGGTFNAISAPSLMSLGNAHWDASGQFEYTTTGAASRYYQAGDQHIWYNAGSGAAGTAVSFSERMRIDSSGNVGIGTSSPVSAIHASGLPTDGILGTFATTAGTYGSKLAINQAGVANWRIGQPAGVDAFAFYGFGAGTYPERLRIDSSGNLLVGKSVTSSNTEGMLIGSNGRFDAVRDGGYVGYFNRLSSDGDIAIFAKDGTTVGSIGNTGAQFVIKSTGANFYLDIPSGGDLRPLTDNAVDLGASARRWDDVYATNGTIQTSDRNEKQDIEVLSDAETRVAQACKGLLRKFRWQDAVAEKGDDARIHFGIIAQDLQDAFAAEGLDAGRYAMFISSTWWETQTEVPVVEAVAEVLDDDGNVVTEAVEAKEAYTRTDTYETQAEAPEGATERTRLGVRYPELLAFIIAAI